VAIKVVLNDFEMKKSDSCERMYFDVTDIIKFSGPGVYVFYAGKDTWIEVAVGTKA